MTIFNKVVVTWDTLDLPTPLPIEPIPAMVAFADALKMNTLPRMERCCFSYYWAAQPSPEVKPL